jgi:hypothetical protein
MKTSCAAAFAAILLLGPATAICADGGTITDGSTFEQCRPELEEGSVEWNRDRTSRTYPDMEEALGIDKPTRERLIDILNDHDMIEQKNVNNYNMRERADAMTIKLRSVRDEIGDARMDAFYMYTHDRAEAYQYQAVNSKLPQEAQLSADQKARLMKLFREAHYQAEHGTLAVWPGTADTSNLNADDQALVQRLSNLAYSKAYRRKLDLLDAAVKQRSAQFLSTAQLEALEAMQREQAADFVKYDKKVHPPMDSAEEAYIRDRVSKLPRYQQPEAITKPVTVQIAIFVDDREPVVMTRTIADATPIPIEVDELTIELTPRLFNNGATFDTHFFNTVAGERRELRRVQMNGTGSERSYVQTAVVEGVRQGYVVTTKSWAGK